jgi:hypothetical protein
MLPLKIRSVYLCEHRVDFRKRFNGLLGEAYGLGFSPYEGDILVFIKKDKRQVWCLLGDAYGLYLICRRFDGGCLKLEDFRFSDKKSAHTISVAELGMLLAGSSFVLKNQVAKWK